MRASRPAPEIRPRTVRSSRYRFLLAVGEQSPSAHPDLARREYVPDCAMASLAGPAGSVASTFTGGNPPKRDYVKKVKVQKKTVAKGGCG